MIKRLFIQNTDAGEPWALCGDIDVDLPWALCGDIDVDLPYSIIYKDQVLKAIDNFVQAEIENAFFNKEDEFTLSFKVVEMSDEEVAALPDI